MTTTEAWCDFSDMPAWMCRPHCNVEPPAPVSEDDEPEPEAVQPSPFIARATAVIPRRRPKVDPVKAARALAGMDAAPIHMNVPIELEDYLDQLAWPMKSQQPYAMSQHNRDGSVTRIQINHPSRHMPLITQLWQAGNQTPHDDEGARPGYASKPTARIDALDAHARIDAEAARWVRRLGDDDPEGTIGVLRHLKGLAAALVRDTKHKRSPACCDWHRLEHDARSWWIQCRVLTGWDSAAWRPDCTCPPCGTRGSLRVKLVAKTAMCVECKEVWDEHTIGLLADHIRVESESDRFANRTPKDPCRCSWPKEEKFGRIVQCPDCGSRYCSKTDEMVVRRQAPRSPFAGRADESRSAS